MPIPGRTVLTDFILEQTMPTITAVLKDSDGTVVSVANVTALTLTYYNLNDGPTFTIINGRTSSVSGSTDGQDVLNTNNVTIDTSGNLKWIMQVEDTVILEDGNVEECHRAIFKFTYNSSDGVKIGKHSIDMTIVNLEKIT